jgi:hypothetical protein
VALADPRANHQFRQYQAEARRQGLPVEKLVEQTVNCLLAELEREQEECWDVGPVS